MQTDRLTRARGHTIGRSPRAQLARVSVAAWVALMLQGCAGEMANMTSGQIGCPREEIAVYDDHVRWGSSNWTAECRGKTYFCSAMAGAISCKDQEGEGGETLAEQRPASSPLESAALEDGLRAGGCAFDTQCKGDRICVHGACAAPAGGRAAVPEASGKDAVPKARLGATVGSR